MNFRFTKKKINWIIIISIIGNILSLYLISSDLVYRGKVKDIPEGILSSFSPLGSGILYLILLFIVMYLVWFVVVYVIWSFFEGKKPKIIKNKIKN